MTQTKRWTITYTKHLTQKRKVYHDGALEVSGTCDKVMLYDDCNTLIASRFLKQDEIVECGATMAFGTHLVDIGEPEGDHKSQTFPNASTKYVKLRGSPGEPGQKNEKVTCESRPSQNYSNTIDSGIKENKKIKLQSRSLHIQLNAMPSKITVGSETKLGTSGVLQTQQDAPKTTRKEWNALYTSHKTQKAKKYHDGVLRLSVCGSHMNQVTLLNEEGAVLSRKYLKSAECVGAGSTYEFPGYLVEIGDPRVSLGDDQINVPLGQVTSSSSSNTRKFTTLKKDPNNKPLHNGSVDIILTNDQHKDPLGQSTYSGSSSTCKFATPTKDPNNEPVLSSEYTRKGKPEEALGCGSSNALDLSTSMGIIRNQQLRDACQVISILKKPLPEENFGPGNIPVDYTTPLCSSDSIQMAGNNKSKTLELTMLGTIYSKSTVLDNHKFGFQEPEIRVATEGDTSARPCLNSITTQIVPATVITLARENEENQAGEGYPNRSKTSELTMPGTIYSKSTVLDNHKCGFQEPEIRVATEGDTSARSCLNSITTQIVPATVITLARENEENQAGDGYPNKSKTLELTMPGTIYSKSTVLDNHKCGFQEPEIIVATQGDTLAKPCLNSVTTQIVPANVITLARENEENQAVEGYPASSNNLSSTLIPEAPSIKLDMQYTVSECADKATSTEVPYSAYTDTGTLPVRIQKNASGSVFSGECSMELADSSSDIVPVKNEFGFFSNIEQHVADSPRSSLKENIRADERTGGDDISSIVSLGVSSPADPRCTDLADQGLPERDMDIDSIPSFDLGF